MAGPSPSFKRVFHLFEMVDFNFFLENAAFWPHGRCIAPCFLYVQPKFPPQSEEMPYGCSVRASPGTSWARPDWGRSLPPQRCPQLATNFFSSFLVQAPKGAFCFGSWNAARRFSTNGSGCRQIWVFSYLTKLDNKKTCPCGMLCLPARSGCSSLSACYPGQY